MKPIFINIVKMSIVAFLLWWMISSGKLSGEQMAVILHRPDAIAASILVWIIGPLWLGTLRWWLLIQGAGLQCGYFAAMRLQLIGYFFNTAMPGAVGGDIVKAVYIVKSQSGAEGKTPAMVTVLLDRIVGLIGLFIMGIIAAGLSYEQLSKNEVTVHLMMGLAVVVGLSAVFLVMVFIPYNNRVDPVERLLSLRIPGFVLLQKIYAAVRSYRERPMILVSTIGISITVQLLFMWFMGFIGQILYGHQAFNISLLAPVFPFGVLATAIPLAPGGLGVGHAVFDHLFALVGLPGGANVFNIFALSQLTLNLLGFIPYLATKNQTPKTAPS
jgi:glycosyltransferase 2 family protein